MVNLVCDRATFRGGETDAVRWLDWDADFEMAQRYWPPNLPLTRDVWDDARAVGYRYCGLIENGQILALAAEFRFSETAWMLAAVGTAVAYRRRGYGKRVSTFVTSHIVGEGRVATCMTRDESLPMIRTAESIGFRRSEPSHAGDGGTRVK